MHLDFSRPTDFKARKYYQKPITFYLLHTAVGVRKTLVLHKQIKNRPTLAYKNSVRKCYEDMFFITNIHFNNPTSSPQT